MKPRGKPPQIVSHPQETVSPAFETGPARKAPARHARSTGAHLDGTTMTPPATMQ